MGLLVDGKWHDQWYDTQKSARPAAAKAAPPWRWVARSGCSP